MTTKTNKTKTPIPKHELDWARSVARGTWHKTPRHIRLQQLVRLRKRIQQIELEIAKQQREIRT